MIHLKNVVCQKMRASMMKPGFLLRLCSFGNKLWSFCEASPWVYVKRILNELLPCLAFCKSSVKHVGVSEQATINFRMWCHHNYKENAIRKTNTISFSSDGAIKSRKASFTDIVCCANILSLNQFSLPYFCFIYNLFSTIQRIMQTFMWYHMALERSTMHAHVNLNNRKGIDLHLIAH